MGESWELQKTTLPPRGVAHRPHHHVHSELWLIREGTVELTINGKSHQLGPGSVGFAHSNDEHGIKNAGTTPATYFVVAVGPGPSWEGNVVSAGDGEERNSKDGLATRQEAE